MSAVHASNAGTKPINDRSKVLTWRWRWNHWKGWMNEFHSLQSPIEFKNTLILEFQLDVKPSLLVTSTDFSSAKLGYQTYHDVIVGPHIPVPKHGKPWTSKMVMFTANASHESASIPWQTLCLPKKYATFLRFERSSNIFNQTWYHKFLKPPMKSRQKSPWHSPGKSWWEPSPHREYRIAPYLPKHPGRLRLLKIFWFFLEK